MTAGASKDGLTASGIGCQSFKTMPAFTFILPPPALADADDALAWLGDDGEALLCAIAAGMRLAPSGAAGAVFDTLHADALALVSYALDVSRGLECEPPRLSLEPSELATWRWATDRLEDALATLALRRDLAPSARRGLGILGAVLSARRVATGDAERAALVLPRGGSRPGR